MFFKLKLAVNVKVVELVHGYARANRVRDALISDEVERLLEKVRLVEDNRTVA